jgi:hypothetical protein
MERQEYDELLRHLVRIAAHQDTINDDLREFARQQREANQRQEITNDRLTMAIERLDTLVARMIERSANGRDA